MMNPYQNDPILGKVWQDGFEYGQNAAEVGTAESLGNASPEVAQEAWNRQQNGDEEFWDQFEESPLSGEWADGPRIEDILANAGVPPEDSLDYYDYLDDAGRVWNDGYSDGLQAGHEAVAAPLAGKMDAPGSTYLPDGWTLAAWHGQDDGWGQLNPENNLNYYLECPNCGKDDDYRESALPGQYHCGVCGEYSNPDATPGDSAPEGVSAQDLEDWPVLPEHQAATNPVNYDFHPFAENELTAFNALPDTERQRWHARAFNLNRRALKGGQEGRVTGRELYALIHRHDNQCAYCDKPLEWAEPGAGRDQAPQAQNSDTAGTIDHNVPLSLGGPGSADNLLPTCWHCNKEMNQWDRRNFDKNLRQPTRIEENPLIDTEPVYARTASDPRTDQAAQLARRYYQEAMAAERYNNAGDALFDAIYQAVDETYPETSQWDMDDPRAEGDFEKLTDAVYEAMDRLFPNELDDDLEDEGGYLAKVAINKVQVKCPNCGTLGETEVCTNCGKSLVPEWNKLDQGKDVPWESLPQMGTPQNEWQSDPTDRVPKVNWGQQDNQFGTMISTVRVAVEDSEDWRAPVAPPGAPEGHGDLEVRTVVNEDEFF